MNLDGLEAVRQAYEKAELLMKRYERINLENNPEVLKELEDASIAIINAGKLSNGDIKRADLVNTAMKHCDNAVATVRIDCMAGLFDDIDRMLDCDGIEEKDLRSELSDWDSIKAEIKAIRHRWSDEDFTANNDNEEIMEADYRALHIIREKLAAMEPILRELAFARADAASKQSQTIMDEKRRLEQKRSDIHTLVEESASVVSLILTLICAIFGVLGFGVRLIVVCFMGAILGLFFIFILPLFIVDGCIDKKLAMLENEKQGLT